MECGSPPRRSICLASQRRDAENAEIRREELEVSALARLSPSCHSRESGNDPEDDVKHSVRSRSNVR